MKWKKKETESTNLTVLLRFSIALVYTFSVSVFLLSIVSFFIIRFFSLIHSHFHSILLGRTRSLLTSHLNEWMSNRYRVIHTPIHACMHRICVIPDTSHIKSVVVVVVMSTWNLKLLLLNTALCRLEIFNIWSGSFYSVFELKFISTDLLYVSFFIKLNGWTLINCIVWLIAKETNLKKRKQMFKLPCVE